MTNSALPKRTKIIGKFVVDSVEIVIRRKKSRYYWYYYLGNYEAARIHFHYASNALSYFIDVFGAEWFPISERENTTNEIQLMIIEHFSAILSEIHPTGVMNIQKL